MTVPKLNAITPEAVRFALELAPDKAPFLKQLLTRGWSAIMEAEDGAQIAALGVFAEECDPGIFNVWLLPSARFGATPKAPILVKKTLEAILAQFKPRRVQTTARDDQVIKRWLEWLGFEYEGTMKAAGQSGEDLLLYGRVMKW